MHTSLYVCCLDCLIFSDNFQRAELGCQWETVQGSWSILNQRLRESGNAGALAVPYRAAGEQSFYVLGHTPELVNGAVYRVIGNYVDSDNYYFAEFAFSTTEIQVRTYRRAAGNDDLLKSDSWNVNWLGWSGQFLICLSHQSFLAEFNPDASHDERYAVCQGAPSLYTLGYRAGLGNGGSVPVEYDSFIFQETGYTKEGCPTCYCKCPCDPILKTLKMTLSSPDCPAIDGCTWDLVRQGFESVWICDDTNPTCVGLTGVLRASLACDSEAEGEGCEKYRLWFSWVTSDCPVTAGDCERPSQCTCSPFYLRYAGYVMDNMGDCGLCQDWPAHFDIVIWDPEA